MPPRHRLSIWWNAAAAHGLNPEGTTRDGPVVWGALIVVSRWKECRCVLSLLLLVLCLVLMVMLPDRRRVCHSVTHDTRTLPYSFGVYTILGHTVLCVRVVFKPVRGWSGSWLKAAFQNAC